MAFLLVAGEPRRKYAVYHPFSHMFAISKSEKKNPFFYLHFNYFDVICTTKCMRKQWASWHRTESCGCETEAYRTNCGPLGCFKYKWDYCDEKYCSEKIDEKKDGEESYCYWCHSLRNKLYLKFLGK